MLKLNALIQWAGGLLVTTGLIMILLSVGASGLVRWNGLVPELMLFVLVLEMLAVSFLLPTRRGKVRR